MAVSPFLAMVALALIVGAPETRLRGVDARATFGDVDVVVLHDSANLERHGFVSSQLAALGVDHRMFQPLPILNATRKHFHVWQSFVAALESSHGEWTLLLEDDAELLARFPSVVARAKTSSASLTWLDTRATFSYNALGVPLCCLAGVLYDRRGREAAREVAVWREDVVYAVDLFLSRRVCREGRAECRASPAVRERRFASRTTRGDDQDRAVLARERSQWLSDLGRFIMFTWSA